MNPIQTLAETISNRFPNAKVSLDAPEVPTGAWFLDVTLDGYPLTIEWRRQRGFGITAGKQSAFGEGPDEVIPELETASRRVVALLLSKMATRAPHAVRLREIRSAAGVSQIELAKRLKIKQAAVSKSENRGDMKITTLSQFVEALGAELIISVKLDNGEVFQLAHDTETPPKRSQRKKTRRGAR